MKTIKRMFLLLFIVYLFGGFAFGQAPTEEIDLFQEDPLITDASVQVIQKASPKGVWDGFTKDIPYRQMIPPYGLEVCFEKTTHIIFPSAIVYVDLGNDYLMAAKAGDAENVLRVKSADLFFDGETNLSVITNQGSFYTFNVKFAREPEKLSIEMQDFMDDGSTTNRPNNSLDIFLKELGNESPSMVRLLMQTIYNNNQRIIKHIGSNSFGVQFLLKGMYSHGDLLYFHTELKNTTNVAYDIDYLTFAIVDKKLILRTTMQETVLKPVRAYNYVTCVNGKEVQRSVFVFPRFTVPDTKMFKIDLHEKSGGRHQQFTIENTDIVRAKLITELLLN